MENSYSLSTTSPRKPRNRIRARCSLESVGVQEVLIETDFEISSAIARSTNITTASVGFLSVLLVIITYGFQKAIQLLTAFWNLKAAKTLFTWIDDLLGLRRLRSLTYDGPFAFPIQAFKDELHIRLERLKIPVNLISTISSEIAAAYHFAFSDDMEAKSRPEFPERAQLQHLARLQRLEIDRLRHENDVLKCELSDYEHTITEVINQISPSPSLELEAKEGFIDREEARIMNRRSV